MEDENREKFIGDVLAALLLFGTTRKLGAALLVPRLRRALIDVQKSARDLGEEDAGADTPMPSKKQREASRLILESASAGLAATLLRSAQAKLLDGDTAYRDIAREAARENAKRIALAADTEFYRSYNEAWISSVKKQKPDARLVWVALLDKHTCPECEALDGTEALASEGFKIPPPLHPRCRCIINTV